MMLPWTVFWGKYWCVFRSPATVGVETPVIDMKPECFSVCWQVVLEGQRTFDFHAVHVGVILTCQDEDSSCLSGLLCLFTRACVCGVITPAFTVHHPVMSMWAEAGVVVLLSPPGPWRQAATLVANTHFDQHTTLCVFSSCEMMQP